MGEELKDSGTVTAMSVVGFVFGLIGMLGSFIPCLGSLAFYIGIPAAVISGIALGIAYSQNAKRTFAIVAVTISLIGVVISGWQYFSIISAGNKAKQALENMTNRSFSAPPTTLQAPAPINEPSPLSHSMASQSGNWVFGRADGSVIAKGLSLSSGGRINGYSHQNENSWAIKDGDLVFLHQNGSITTRFNRIKITDQGIVLTGSFIPDKNVTHMLTCNEFEFGRADGSVIAKGLSLSSGGRINGYSHQNESSWAIKDGDLVFLHQNGSITTRFDRVKITDQGVVLIGSFLPDKNVTHMLTCRF